MNKLWAYEYMTSYLVLTKFVQGTETALYGIKAFVCLAELS